MFTVLKLLNFDVKSHRFLWVTGSLGAIDNASFLVFEHNHDGRNPALRVIFCLTQRSREADAWGKSSQVLAMLPCAPNSWFSGSTACHITKVVGALVRLAGQESPWKN